ncbi:MAG: membrane protein insertase YidC [Peptococcaceae bacterium]|nr:membrane protein insertase YidC [Peptococcaceae bacterium]
MDLINSFFGIPLGYFMYYCYQFVGNYGLTIVIFTIFTKVFLFPLSLIAQKNSIKMVRMQPQLEEIKQRYSGEHTLLLQEQKKLYKQEKYSIIKGMLPLLIQIPIILGLISVMYNPLQHLLHLDQDSISLLLAKTLEHLNMADLGYSAQLQIMEVVQANPQIFSSVPSSDAMISQILDVNLNFLGLNMAQIPSLFNITLIIPLLSGLSAFLLCVVQNKYNVLQQEQGALSKWGITVFLVVFSTYFAFVVPCGIGLYWIFGNVLSVPVLAICNLIYNPRKYIDYENRSQKQKLTKDERKEMRALKTEMRTREKKDKRRFYASKKHLVFYSESSGFYKYFNRIIDHITQHSDIIVHYITSDYNDQIFNLDTPKIEPYYFGNYALISVMMKMDADIVVMTMPDLEKYHIKRSLVRKDIEYVYLDHGMTSLHLMMREGALDHFDTIFCNGPNHVEEVRETERVYNLPAKNLVKTGYVLLDTLLENVSLMKQGEQGEQAEQGENERKRILIAPSWQKNNIMELCLDEIVQPLLRTGYCIIIRPHPEFVKRFPAKMKRILEKYADVISETFIIETDFSSNFTVYTSDLVITDWSSIAQEFSYATKKPSLFINTPMKIMNPEYKKIPLVPLDISMRDEIGVSLDVDKLNTLADVIEDLFARAEAYKKHIAQILEDNIFNIGSCAQVGGEYLINAIKERLKVSGSKEPEQKMHSETGSPNEHGAKDLSAKDLERVIEDLILHSPDYRQHITQIIAKNVSGSDDSALDREHLLNTFNKHLQLTERTGQGVVL